MNRNELISRLVARKMTLSRPTKTFCICSVGLAKKICFAGTQRPAAGGPKN